MKKFLVITLVACAALSMAQQGQGRRGGFQGGGRTQSLTGLLQRQDVKTELKITADEQTKLDELMPRRGGGQRGQGGQGGGQGGPPPQGSGGQPVTTNTGQRPDPAQMQAQMMEREKTILAVLDEGQVKRLKELYVQRAGFAALLRPDFQDALGLSADTKAKIADLNSKAQDANRQIGEKLRNQEIERADAMQSMQANQKTLNESIGKLLTTEQAAKFKDMGGAPFTFEDNNNGPGARAGGN